MPLLTAHYAISSTLTPKASYPRYILRNGGISKGSNQLSGTFWVGISDVERAEDAGLWDYEWVRGGAVEGFLEDMGEGFHKDTGGV